MADQLSRLNVLIASPGDVKEEREVAARVIDEINRLIDKESIQLRARMWETDAVTQLGERTQSIVNDQIADACDIYIGIMWSRVGTPTGEAESGTIEEFRRAKARLDNNPRSVRMLFFFCNKQLPFDVNIDQLVAARRFRAEVERLGLVSTYVSLEEFELKLRQSIHKHATDWGNSWGPEFAKSVDSRARDDALVDANLGDAVEEIGFLDAIEEAEEDAGVATKALERISVAIEELGSSIHQRTADLNKYVNMADVDMKGVKKVSDLAADHLENFASRASVDIPILQKALSKSLERMSDIVLLSQDFSLNESRRSDLAILRSTLSQLGSQMQQSYDSTVGFRQSIVDVPRMTTRFNGAKRQANKVLTDFIDGMQENLQLIAALLGQIDGLS